MGNTKSSQWYEWQDYLTLIKKHKKSRKPLREISNNHTEQKKIKNWREHFVAKIIKIEGRHAWAGKLAKTVEKLATLKPFQWNACVFYNKEQIKSEKENGGYFLSLGPQGTSPQVALIIENHLNNPRNCLGEIIALFRKLFQTDPEQKEPVEGVAEFIKVMTETICIFYAQFIPPSTIMEVKRDIKSCLIEKVIQGGVWKVLQDEVLKEVQDTQQMLDAAINNVEIKAKAEAKVRHTIDEYKKTLRFIKTIEILRRICNAKSIARKFESLKALPRIIKEDSEKITGFPLQVTTDPKKCITNVLRYTILAENMKDILQCTLVLEELNKKMQQDPLVSAIIQLIKNTVSKIERDVLSQ